jgi:hypothetical protein
VEALRGERAPALRVHVHAPLSPSGAMLGAVRR